MNRFSYSGEFIYGKGIVNDKDKRMSLFKYNYLKKIIVNRKIKVLEVGCGGGQYLRALKRDFPLLELCGVDLDRRVILHNKTVDDDIKYRQGNLLNIPYPKSYFDVVIAMDVIEHVRDTQRALGEISRVLKKEGIFHSFVPCEDNPLSLYWILHKLGLFKDITERFGGHVVAFSIKRIKDEVNKAGFKIIRNRPSEYYFFQLFEFLFFLLFYIRNSKETSLWEFTSPHYQSNDTTNHFFSKLFNKCVILVYLISYYESRLFRHKLGAKSLNLSAIKE